VENPTDFAVSKKGKKPQRLKTQGKE